MPALTGLRRERAEASRQWRNGKFRNTLPVGPRIEGGSLPIMRDYFFGESRVPSGPLPVESPLEAWSKPVSSSGFRVTWLGHSTVLLELDGLRVLTDPVFGERASP